MKFPCFFPMDREIARGDRFRRTASATTQSRQTVRPNKRVPQPSVRKLAKTHLAIAIAASVIRARARGRFFNLVDLVNQLEQEKAAGKSGRIVEALLRHDLVAIDELGYLPFSQSGAQLLFSASGGALLFHLLSKLYERTSSSSRPILASVNGPPCSAIRR